MIKFDNSICHLTFSHNDCQDIWPAYFGETRKYFKNNMKHFLCVDKVTSSIPEGVTPLLYDSTKPYPQRLLSCLEQLEKFDFVFFDHEDMFLYKEPNFNVLNEYYNFLKSGQVDHIRLIKGGLSFSSTVKDIPSLHKLSLFSKWIFSIQPSFWKREKFIEVLKENLDCNIWDLERKSQKVVKNLKLKAAYSHLKGSQRRGYFHFDNDIYPFIATAIGKGKWNYSEYKTELDKVFNEYNIDPDIRGKH